jgi:hypothetical protein
MGSSRPATPSIYWNGYGKRLHKNCEAAVRLGERKSSNAWEHTQAIRFNAADRNEGHGFSRAEKSP